MQDGAPEAGERDGVRAVAPRAPVLVVVVASAAVIVGVGLRFVTRSALWLDEALTVNIASLPIRDLLEALRSDGHPPLYYLLLHGWIELFGTSDLAVRSLSGVIGVLALAVAWWYGRRRGGPVMGWFLVAIVAVSPFAVRYATETRMYSLVILLVFVGAVLLDDIFGGRDGWGRLAVFTLTATALLYTHYWSLWLLGAVGILVLWRLWRDRDPQVRRTTLRVLGSLVLAGVLFVPWLPTLLYQSANTGTPWAGPSRPTTVVAVTFADFVAGAFPDGTFIKLVVGAVVLLGLLARGIDRRTVRLDLRTERAYRPEALVLVLAMVLGVGVTYATWSAFATRYAAVVFPLFAVLVAAGLTCFIDRRVQVGIFVFVLGLLSMGAGWNVLDQRTQAREIAGAISAEAEPGDLVIYCPDQLGPAGSRELQGEVDQVVYPTFAAPERVDWVDYAARNEAADPEAFAAQSIERAGGNAVFVVWNASYRTFDGQCEALVDAIARARPARELVGDGGGTYFEHATVTWAPRR